MLRKRLPLIINGNDQFSFSMSGICVLMKFRVSRLIKCFPYRQSIYALALYKNLLIYFRSSISNGRAYCYSVINYNENDQDVLFL